MCMGQCRPTLSILVPMIFDEVQLPMNGNEVCFCLLIFPHQASLSMGNEGKTGFTIPFRTMKIKVIMVLQHITHK